MKIAKGTLLNVVHDRQGDFVGYATRDFDTEIEEFYPITLYDEELEGPNKTWYKDDSMPCRNTLCKITIREDMPNGA